MNRAQENPIVSGVSLFGIHKSFLFFLLLKRFTQMYISACIMYMYIMVTKVQACIGMDSDVRSKMNKGHLQNE